MKKYLEKAEDVIKELKKGKKVFASTAPYAYKMVDGVICYYDTESDNKLLGLNAFVSMEYAPYIEEEKPLTIEVGKFYRTRDGRKAYCYRFEKGTNLENAFCEFVIDNYGCFTTKTNGKVIFNENNEDDLDIVDYWE